MVTATSTRNSPRLPPHNHEAEESVLGAILLSPVSAHEVMHKLQPQDFFDPAHSAIFGAVQSLYRRNRPIDAITLANSLKEGSRLEEVGGMAKITELAGVVPVASNIEYYADIVIHLSQRRQLIDAAAQISNEAFRLNESIETVIDRAESKILSVSHRQMGDGLLPLDHDFFNILQEIEELGERGEEVSGLPTGFTDIDLHLGGLQPANLIVVAARPSMGKSAFAVNVVTNVALHNYQAQRESNSSEDDNQKPKGKTIALFSLEMTRTEIVHRMLCSIAHVDSKNLRTGKLEPREWQKIVKAAEPLYGASIYIDDSSGITTTAIRAKTRRLKRQKGLDLIVVDYLQLMQGSHQETRQQEIAEISRSLKDLARDLKVPVIAVSQLNRGVELRDDKRPRLSDLRESGSIEQDSDVVMFIYRDEYYNYESGDKGKAEVQIAKNRTGATTKVDLTFLGRYTAFENRAEAPTRSERDNTDFL